MFLNVIAVASIFQLYCKSIWHYYFTVLLMNVVSLWWKEYRNQMYCISSWLWHEELDDSLTVNVVMMPNVLSHNCQYPLTIVILFSKINPSFFLCLYVNFLALWLIVNADVIFGSTIILFIYVCEYFALHSFLMGNITADVNMYYISKCTMEYFTKQCLWLMHMRLLNLNQIST